MRYILLVLLLFFVVDLSAQTRITRASICAEVSQSTLVNINKEYSGIGHSVQENTQNPRISLSLNYLKDFAISTKFYISTGAGIKNLNSQFHFEYFNSLNTSYVDKDLRISLYYINLPLSIGYRVSLKNKSNLNFNIGINTKFLALSNDNYEEIIFESILLNKFRYNFLIFEPKISTSYQFHSKSGRQLEGGLFYCFDIKPVVGDRGDFGFYKNLSTAKYINYGLSFKYFFNY